MQVRQHWLRHLSGARSKKLRALAQTPDIHKWLDTQPATLAVTRPRSRIVWIGATVRNLVGVGAMSEKDALTETGFIVEIVPPGLAAGHARLQPGDLLPEVNGAPVATTD